MSKEATRPINPQFLLLMSGQFISNIGDALAGMALVWLVIQLTNSPMTRGISLALSVLPALLLSPVSGTMVDRYRRRSILASSDFIRFVIDAVFALVVMLGSVQVWYIYLFTILRSAATIFYDPALTALIQTLIPREQLVKANGQQLLVRNVTIVIGPALAGLCLAKIGIGAVVLVDGLTFLVSAAVLLVMKVPEDRVLAVQRTSTREQLSAGWCYVKERNWIIVLTLSFVLLNAGSSIMSVVLPFFAKDVLHLDATGYGLLTSVSAAGAVAASLLLSVVKLSADRHRTLVVAVIGSALGMLLLSFSGQMVTALPFLFLRGFAGPFVGSTSNALYQAAVPREYMGRVGVFRRMVSISMMPVAFFGTGLLTTVLGYQRCLLVAGCLMATTAAIIYFLVKLPSDKIVPIQQVVEGS